MKQRAQTILCLLSAISFSFVAQVQGAGEQQFGPTGIFGTEDQKVITACGLRVVAKNSTNEC